MSWRLSNPREERIRYHTILQDGKRRSRPINLIKVRTCGGKAPTKKKRSES
jgi:hypothetical protein